MKQRRAALLAAYVRTTYTAQLPDGETLALRIGEPSPRLDRLLQSHGTDCWAYVTACNPQSVPLATGTNTARHRSLVEYIRGRAWTWYEGHGVPDASDWAPETGVLILGVSAADAHALGRCFGQAAVICGRIGGSPELVWC